MEPDVQFRTARASHLPALGISQEREVQLLKFGIDVFLQSARQYKQRRLALVTNHAAVTTDYRPSRKALLDAGYKLILLFSPEHGLFSNGRDGQEMEDGIDPLTGLPIFSLYGSRLKPEPAQLAEVDAVLFDLPDIGCRFYTYLWTLSYVMEACAESAIDLIVLDRPNPISGDMTLCEGPLLDEQHCSSFIGRWSIPLRHSCSLGELARFWKQTRLSALNLDVFPVEGWNRSRYYSEWATSFVPTSPAMVDAEAALLYPGIGLLEATNLSEGRGTATPFRIAGAPWIEALDFAKSCNLLRLPGIYFRAVDFIPETGPYAKQQCHGVMLHITDRSCFRPVYTGLAFIRTAKDMYQTQFQWSRYISHVNPSGKRHLDMLLGMRNAEEIFDLPFGKFQSIATDLLATPGWAYMMRPHLLY